MANLAIIPARGGSKRIPRKNIINFLGSPIIKYSIDAALKSKCFDEVMVSTDDKEIAKVAKKFKASVPFFRSKKNSSDKATIVDVLLEVIGEYKKAGKEFDYVCCILPTAPLIRPTGIKLGFTMLKGSKADVLMPVVQFSYPIHRAFGIKNNRLKVIWPQNMFKNSQDLPLTYHDSGQFYWLKTKSFLTRRKLFSSNAIPLVIPELEAQDIDVLEDLKIAELKYKLLSGSK